MALGERIKAYRHGAGMIFGSYPEGTAIGHNHYGWAIWGASYLISIVTGVLVEIKPINYRIFLHLKNDVVS